MRQADPRFGINPSSTQTRAVKMQGNGLGNQHNHNQALHQVQPSPIHFKNLEKAKSFFGVWTFGAGGNEVAGFVASIFCKIA